ncbi:MAG: hypothetical protein K2Q22_05690, partial [Cytophagales bacterium]|nr:hypothetical protein [Cytophagales bacterium]
FIGGKPFLTSSNSTQVTSNLLYTGGLLLTRNIKNFELGIGISWFKGSFNYKSSNTASSISNLDSTYTVLLDSYIQNIGGKDTTVYITEERDTSFTRTSYITTHHSGNPSYTYIQIPIGVGYKFNLWKDKLHLIPRVQFIYGICTHAITDGYDSPGTSTLSYTAQLNFSYALTSYLSVLAKGQWESYFIQPFPSQTFQSFTYGAGIVVHF